MVDGCPKRALKGAPGSFNGGVMPAHPGALAAAGIASDPQAFSNSIAVPDAQLSFLGDVLWLPASWPVSNVFSIGDCLILAGAFLALHTIAGSRLSVRRLAVPGRVKSPRTSPV